MKKLTLDQLQVDSFAEQPSQKELSNLKGGTTLLCIKVIRAASTTAPQVKNIISPTPPPICKTLIPPPNP